MDNGNNTTGNLARGNMKRKVGLALAGLLALVAGVAASARDDASAQAPAPSRPNIVVLETDDQTLAEMQVLPNVRRLIGDQGVTFDNHFVSFSLCCPSRATFLTGQYSHNNGVRGNALPEGGYEKLDSTNTLPVWLQRAGYYTVQLGKYLNGYGRRNPLEIPPGWTEWRGSIDPFTYRFYGYTLNENGVLTTYCAIPEPSCYQTDVYRDKANEIIRRRAPEGPFFLWVNWLADHSGGPREPDDPRGVQATPHPAPRHQDALSDTPMPRPPNFNEVDVSDKPLVIRRRPLMNERRIAAVQENWQQRRESLMAVDEAVASIIETLRQTGELDNTLVIFTTDNGFFHGEHRIPSGKVQYYEESIHTPLLMRWTGNRSLPRGHHAKQLVSNIDQAATILAAAKATPARVLDGVSLLQLWRDRGRELGRDLLIDNMPGSIHFDAIRTRRYKYVEHLNGDRELYDLARDQHELESQHANPTYNAVKASLADRLHRLVECAGVSCRARPTVTFAAARNGRCGNVRATISGPGVQLAAFTVNGVPRAKDGRAPFRVNLNFQQRAVVRARVTLAFDRVVTLDRVVRACG
jgi:N-acetylglucosamine-6-sulfatase